MPDGILSPREQLVIESLYFREVTAEELEKKMGIGREAIYTAKSKGLKNLRRHFRARQMEEQTRQ